MPEFLAERSRGNKSILIQAAIGWALMLFVALLYMGKPLPWFASIVALLGLYLGVLRWMFQGRGEWDKTLTLARKQADWFRDVKCKNCGEAAAVNIGFSQFCCESCGWQTWRRAGVPIRAIGSGKVLNNPEPPERSMLQDDICPNCRKQIVLRTRPVKFLCPNCHTYSRLDDMPL